MRTGPFFAGTVNRSPRAANMARLPRGEISNASMYFEASREVGSVWRKSPVTVIGTAALWRVAGSKTHRRPPDS